MIRETTFSKWWKVGGITIYGKNEGENCKIAQIETERFDFQKQDVEDCARLIAHAPELFEQFKAMKQELMHAKRFLTWTIKEWPSMEEALEKADKLIIEISCAKEGSAQ